MGLDNLSGYLLLEKKGSLSLISHWYSAALLVGAFNTKLILLDNHILTTIATYAKHANSSFLSVETLLFVIRLLWLVSDNSI